MDPLSFCRQMDGFPTNLTFGIGWFHVVMIPHLSRSVKSRDDTSIRQDTDTLSPHADTPYDVLASQLLDYGETRS